MNNKLEKKYLKINQRDFVMYTTVITVEELLNNTYIEYYNPDNEMGYQRQLVTSHYKKISKFLKETSNPIMPDAIICAIDKKDIEIDNKKSTLIFHSELRIVDGQHRKEGFKYLFEKNSDQKENFLKYEIPMIVLVIESDNDKIIEIETFVNINSKGKKVKTDLAIELRNKLRNVKKERFEDKNDFIESLATKIAKICNEQENQPWKNKIKMAEEIAKKPIGSNTFKQAIKSVIDSYINMKNIDFKRITIDGEDYEELVQKISNLFIEAWKVIFEKWEEAFSSYIDYNIMKSVGVYSINEILSETVNVDEAESLKNFKEKIQKSKKNSNVWRRGGILSGYSSAQGFKEVKKIILSEEEK